ncbi:MAG: hypothetical protein JW751_19015 [Polyangiaceae bacterium]|nr:hypothetical protein [Polyangiaceae bacterium]
MRSSPGGRRSCPALHQPPLEVEPPAPLTDPKHGGPLVPAGVVHQPETWTGSVLVIPSTGNLKVNRSVPTLTTTRFAPTKTMLADSSVKSTSP